MRSEFSERMWSLADTRAHEEFRLHVFAHAESCDWPVSELPVGGYSTTIKTPEEHHGSDMEKEGIFAMCAFRQRQRRYTSPSLPSACGCAAIIHAKILLLLFFFFLGSRAWVRSLDETLNHWVLFCVCAFYVALEMWSQQQHNVGRHFLVTIRMLIRC